MNRFKFQAYMDEFPGVKELTRGDEAWCDGIAVKRIDKHLLEHVPKYSGATGSLVDIDEGEEISFVLEDGVVLKFVVQTSGNIHHNEAHQDAESWSGESVLEAIDRHCIDDDTVLKLIVSVEYGYNTRGHHSKPNWRMTIYKGASDDTIKDLLRRARGQARAQVQAEAAF